MQRTAAHMLTGQYALMVACILYRLLVACTLSLVLSLVPLLPLLPLCARLALLTCWVEAVALWVHGCRASIHASLAS